MSEQILKVKFIDGRWCEVAPGGYASGYFQGWETEPPAKTTMYLGVKHVVLGEKRIAGEDYVFLINEGKESDWVIKEGLEIK